MHKIIDGQEVPLTEEEVAEFHAKEAAAEREAQKVSVINQIKALEAQITPRRLREAILGTDKGWLQNVDSQLAALRHQLSAI
jgi:hypothetical protein